MECILEGKLITKERRREMFGEIAGGAGSMRPEQYQREKIIQITGRACSKTTSRINLRTNVMKELSRPNIREDGFDYSENFDGVQVLNDKIIYINLKCIVGEGGAQTRSLREVYWFINGQMNVAEQNENICFANILDGDESHSAMDKFEYLLSQAQPNVKRRIYVGDLLGYFSWFERLRDEMQ
jgi:hypothetical protein